MTESFLLFWYFVYHIHIEQFPKIDNFHILNFVKSVTLVEVKLTRDICSDIKCYHFGL